MVTCVQPPAVLLCLPHIWHSCFVSFWGWFEAENPNLPLLSQTGGSHHPKECAQLWEATTSRSIPVRASQVHPWKQSMTPVSPWPESCAEERHQHGGFLLQPRSLFFSLCLPSLPRHCLFPLSPVLALDIGISIEACSVVSAQQVSASS